MILKIRYIQNAVVLASEHWASRNYIVAREVVFTDLVFTEVHSEASQTSEMELFAKLTSTAAVDPRHLKVEVAE